MAQHGQGVYLAQQQGQKLALTAAMVQSLEILRMPVQELADYIEQQLHENPMLELDEKLVKEESELFSPISLPEEQAQEDEFLPGEDKDFLCRRHQGGDFYTPNTTQYNPTRMHTGWEGESLKAVLAEQIATLPLDEGFCRLCMYLVECLNSKGYFTFELADIAQELNIATHDVAQALYVVQSLQPAGVAARSLQECLLLQLAQGAHFNHYTIKIVQEGLFLLAENDIGGLAKLLCCSQGQAQHSAGVIRGLNPIPSRGYATGEVRQYIVPDAAVTKENGALVVTLNTRALPPVELNEHYCSLMRQAESEDTGQYLKNCHSQAQVLVKAVGDRNSTLHKVIQCVVQLQAEYFASGSAPQPMALQDVAQRLGVHISTVSRAIQEKYIICAAGTVALKTLFATGVQNTRGEWVSSILVREKLEKCVMAEDKTQPLSDEDLRQVLQAMGIDISRRTVAKYRDELGIAKAGKRRR